MLGFWLKLLVILFIAEPVWATDQSFNVSLKLFQPIAVTKKQDILFPSKILTGTSETIVVNTGDTGAAVFDAYGGKNRTLVRSVVESDIILSAPGVTDTITVNAFSVAGPLAFDSTGKASDFKIGATANILANSQDGDYTGVGSFRVIYQ